MAQTVSNKSLPVLVQGSENYGKRPVLKLHTTDSTSYMAGNGDPEAGNKAISTFSMRQKIFLRQRRSGLNDSSEEQTQPQPQPQPAGSNEYDGRHNAPPYQMSFDNILPKIGQRSNSRPRNGPGPGPGPSDLTHKTMFQRSRNSQQNTYQGIGQTKTLQSRSTATLTNPQPFIKTEFNQEIPTKKSLFTAINTYGGGAGKGSTSRNTGLTLEKQSDSMYELSNSKIFKSVYAVESRNPTPSRYAATDEKAVEEMVDEMTCTVSSRVTISEKTLDKKEVDRNAKKQKPTPDASVQAYLNYQQKRQERNDKEVAEKQKSAQLRNWIQWGEHSEPLSDYQRMQDSFKTFSQKDITAMKKLSYIGQTNLKSLAQRGKVQLKLEEPTKVQKTDHQIDVLVPKGKFHAKLISPMTRKEEMVQKKNASLSTSKKQVVSITHRQLNKESSIAKDRTKSTAAVESLKRKNQPSTSLQSISSLEEIREKEAAHIKDHLNIDTNALKKTRQTTFLLTEGDQVVEQRRVQAQKKGQAHIIAQTTGANPAVNSVATFNDNSSDGSSAMNHGEHQPLKAGFLKRFDFGMQAFLKNQRHNQGYVMAIKYEQNYLKTILTSPWKQTARVSKTQDQDRVQVLDYMTRELKEILQNVGERNFNSPIQRMRGLVLVCKQLYDPKPTIYAYQMYSCLLLHNDHPKEACQVLEVAKDLAHESQNLAQEMICYELIGKVLQVKGEFQQAKIAFKKMLQLAWLTHLTDYEYRAYTEIAKQYFYLERVDKSREYHMKALNGDMEKYDNPERVISEDLYRKKQRAEGDMGKYERMGCRVHRQGAIKVIDYTQNFAEVVAAIEQMYSTAEKLKDNPLIENKFAMQMIELRSRKIGRMLVRMGTPTDQMQDDVHSPRLDHGEISPQNGLDNTMDQQRKGCLSPQRDLRTVLRTKPKQSPDYLTPMRENREYQESIRYKNNEVNFSEMKAKAKGRRLTQNKQKVQLRHLAYQGKLIHSQSSQFKSHQNADSQVKESTFHQQKLQMLKARQMRQKTQSSKGGEVEAIEQQRRLARDANKTEQVQKEINTYGYPLLEYLRKMKKCSYQSAGEKTSRFGTKVQYLFYSDRHCQQVHDLLL